MGDIQKLRGHRIGSHRFQVQSGSPYWVDAPESIRGYIYSDCETGKKNNQYTSLLRFKFQ